MVLMALAAPLAAQAGDAVLIASNGVRAEAAPPAAEEGAAEGAAPAGQLQSITVTATKHKEDIKDIPTSVSAIDADQLADHHVANYDDITRTVPGISFQAGAGPGLDNIEIRGVSSTSGSATVGIYIDEVPVTVKNTYDGAVEPKLFDLERVEVLRGPQGTLYGASSMGGTIRFITKTPDVNAFSGSASTDLSYTKHGALNNDTNAILNIPVVPGTFALRIGADASYESGYVDHYQPTPNGFAADGSLLGLGGQGGPLDSTGVLAQKRVNDVHTDVLRVSGKYVGSGDLTITPALFVQKTTTGDSGIFYLTMDTYQQDKRVGEPGKDVLTVPSVTVTKGFESMELTSVTSYFRRDFRRTTDGTYYNSNLFASCFVVPIVPNSACVPQQPIAAADYQALGILGFLPSIVYYDTTTDQFSQELRLASKEAQIGGMPVTWAGGVYFSNNRQTHTDDEFIPGLQASYQAIYGQAITSNPGINAPGVSYANDLIYLAHNHQDERQIAPFGEVGIAITPQLKSSFGLRYVSAKSSYGFTSGGFFALGLPNPYTDDEKFSATTPKASLDYAISENSTVYASVAKGFRLGGPTGPDPAPGGTCDPDYRNLGISSAPLKYDSDSLWSYEAGSKGRYFNNRLSVNAALYAISWKNIQQSVNLPTCGFSFTTNAGDAKSYGTEIEVRAMVIDALTVSLNAGTTHAFITRSSYPGIFGVGEEVLNVPDYSATLSADYDQPISDTTTAFVRADFPYVGRSHAYYNSSNYSNHWSPNYGILNLNIGISQKKLSVALYAKNLLDQKKIIQYPQVNSVPGGYSVRPLTAGVTVSLQL